MPNQKYLSILKQGAIEWNTWRHENPEVLPDFRHADLRNTDLRGFDLSCVDLRDADLSGANLSGVNFHGSDLSRANLSQTELVKTDFCRADLWKSNLSAAKLIDANLKGCQLAETDLRNAELMNCEVYGSSAWGLKTEGTVQIDLVLSPPETTKITVDNIEVAQFIHLLLNNKKLRDVINTVTSKVVLILGRFTQERMKVLNSLRDALRHTSPPYVPVMFDFQKPTGQDFIETVSTIAHMSRFVIADVTDPKIVLEEIPHIVRNLAIPVLPILEEGSGDEPVTLYNLRRNHRSLLPTLLYKDTADLLDRLDKDVIKPSEDLLDHLRAI